MTSETYSDASVAEAQHPDNAARNKAAPSWQHT